MSWSVTVEHKEMPDPQERIASISSALGSLVSVTARVSGKRLVDFETTEEKISALKTLIEEIDYSEELKGAGGEFTNDFAVDCDLAWSNGRESKSSWSEISFLSERSGKNTLYPFGSYEEHTGYTYRSRLRSTAFRFYCYYKMGYEVKLEW